MQGYKILDAVNGLFFKWICFILTKKKKMVACKVGFTGEDFKWQRLFLGRILLFHYYLCAKSRHKGIRIGQFLLVFCLSSHHRVLRNVGKIKMVASVKTIVAWLPLCKICRYTRLHIKLCKTNIIWARFVWCSVSRSLKLSSAPPGARGRISWFPCGLKKG